MTIKQLSGYQVEQLRHYFMLVYLTKFGINEDNGDVIIEYQNNLSREMNTIAIPRNELLTDAEFEIIQPKQISQ